MASEESARRIVAELEKRTEMERAAGAYADDLSDVELDVIQGFDLGETRQPIRFRPELGFSSKPVIGPPITLVKRILLRLLFYVFDDLARQTDEALQRVETALEVEIAARGRLERETEKTIRELQRELRLLRDRADTDAS